MNPFRYTSLKVALSYLPGNVGSGAPNLKSQLAITLKQLNIEHHLISFSISYLIQAFSVFCTALELCSKMQVFFHRSLLDVIKQEQFSISHPISVI